uniref:helix-turn-helix transcriptional regulator n=1 Tax=Streptomyces sp. IBSBF 3136 TaxID=2903524 RepID=UPI002FDBAA41
MSELFDAVDALVASRSPLPPPAERRRLRQAHALTLDEVATALGVRRATIGDWETGKTEPRPPQRDAYARLLKQLTQLYPAESTGAPQEDTAAQQTAPPTAPKTPHAPTGPEPDAAAPAASDT